MRPVHKLSLFLSAVTASAVLILAAGCGGRPDEPAALAESYYRAFADGDYDRQYKHLSPAVRKFESFDEFKGLMEEISRRNRLVKFELKNKPGESHAEPWRAFFRMTWEAGKGKKHHTWQGISLTRRAGSWWVLDTPVTRQRASAAYIAGEHGKATELLDRILRFNPTDAETLDLLGYVLRDNEKLRNNLEFAIEKHRRAIELEPENPDWRLSLGNDYRLLGWHAGAIKEIKKALALEKRANYFVWLGVAYAAAQKVDAARGAWRTAIRLDPDAAQAHAFLEKTK